MLTLPGNEPGRKQPYSYKNDEEEYPRRLNGKIQFEPICNTILGSNQVTESYVNDTEGCLIYWNAKIDPDLSIYAPGSMVPLQITKETPENKLYPDNSYRFLSPFQYNEVIKHYQCVKAKGYKIHPGMRDNLIILYKLKP